MLKFMASKQTPATRKTARVGWNNRTQIVTMPLDSAFQTLCGRYSSIAKARASSRRRASATGQASSRPACGPPSISWRTPIAGSSRSDRSDGCVRHAGYRYLHLPVARRIVGARCQDAGSAAAMAGELLRERDTLGIFCACDRLRELTKFRQNFQIRR